MTAPTLPPIEQVLSDLGNSSVPGLVARYQALFGKPPRSKHRRWLATRLAWQEQAIRFGGLSGAAKRRIAEIQADLQLPDLRAPVTPPVAQRQGPGDSPIGTRLERTWRGRSIVAVRVERGWEVEGVTYRSLSGAAKSISGTHVSGPAWFGLVRGGAR